MSSHLSITDTETTVADMIECYIVNSIFVFPNQMINNLSIIQSLGLSDMIVGIKINDLNHDHASNN